MKTPAPEYFFNKVEDSQIFSYDISEIFYYSFSVEHLRGAASEFYFSFFLQVPFFCQ